MKIIGLAGGSGSGKGEVGKIFADLDIPTIDTDAIYHEMTSADSPCLKALADEFGSGVISDSGALNRASLAKIVFAGDGAESKRLRLNEITHKFILDEARGRLRNFAAQGYSFAAVDAPLLFESGFDGECDVIVSVVAPKDERILRIMQRDGITKEAAIARLESQMSDEELASRSDYVILNDGNLESLQDSVKNTVDKIKFEL